MYSADLVIAAPGLSVFEALCVGTPVIVMPQNSLQKKTYEGFMRVLDKNEVNRLGKMIDNSDFSYPHEEHIMRMEIGEGKSELIEEILK
jgi:spore coat polysaccharide biosynthesis predicted glycosyltransferase SpsG